MWSAVAILMAAMPTGLVAFNFAAANKLAPKPDRHRLSPGEYRGRRDADALGRLA